VFSDLAIFWELSDVFQRFEGILLNFEQFYCRASAQTDEMAVLRANC
jgi:hypothetical protein